MAKIKPNQPGGKQIPGQNGSTPGRGDMILSLIHTGMQDVNSLASTYATFTSARNSRKVTETDNAVKMSRAQTDSQKEDNRHEEEMAKIDQAWEKISKSAEDRDRRLSFIQGQIEKFQAEYDKYMALDTENFLSATVTSRLESLRKVILDLTKELNKA